MGGGGGNGVNHTLGRPPGRLDKVDIMNCTFGRLNVRRAEMYAEVRSEVALQVVDNVCDNMENNGADELVTPRKPNQRCGVARMQAKLVMAATTGKLRDWPKGTVSHCLDVLGVKLPSGNNRREAREIAMQHALPLLAKCDAFVPQTDRVTCSAVPPSSPQPCCSQGPIDDMDGLINE